MVLLDLFGEETVREDVKASTLSGQSFSEEEKEKYWDFCTQSGGFFSIFPEVSSPHQITATAEQRRVMETAGTTSTSFLKFLQSKYCEGEPS